MPRLLVIKIEKFLAKYWNKSLKYKDENKYSKIKNLGNK